MPRAFWFDLDNSPHVPLFRPIFSELEKRGTPCYVTARRHAQTHELLTLWDIKHTLLGTHAGKSKLKKIANLFQRAYGLSRLVRAQELKLAVSHGSRTQVLSAKRLGIPSVVMLDYEFSESRIFNLLASRLLIPSIIPDSRLKSAGFNLKKVIRYNGFKEQIYLKDFVPDKNFRATVGVREDTLLITVRPPSMSGNYHDNRSEALLRECIAHFSSSPEAHVLIVNRTGAEESLVSDLVRRHPNVSFLQKPVDGLQLIWASDIVVSGGGTMNRESALLGVPTFSIFTGPRPYLDEYLQWGNKLKFIQTIDEVRSIPLAKRSVQAGYTPENTELASTVTDILVDTGNTLAP